MLVAYKIHFPSAKPNAFDLEAQALLRARFETEFDFAARPYYPLPRK